MMQHFFSKFPEMFPNGVETEVLSTEVSTASTQPLSSLRMGMLKP